MATLAELELEAQVILTHAQEVPENRLTIRQAFYCKYGYGELTEYGFGNSEIAFLEWEIRRGVFDKTKGSAWWSAVNSDFIYYSTLAGLIFESGQTFKDLPLAVQAWLAYLQSSSPQTWYQAHNTSIATGYSNRIKELPKENYFEVIFVNIVLYRLLFAGALAQGKDFGRLGEILCNPKLPAVDVMVSMPSFYPENYPLSKQDILNVLHLGHNIEDKGAIILDELIILPQLESLYQFTADLLRMPVICQWCVDGMPAYPEPYGAMARFSLWRFILRFIKKNFHSNKIKIR